MKIERLELRAFGPFTDLVLDLNRRSDGLHVVYGPNEAGKSSALRALRQFFFGIDSRTSDDFLHPYGNLRIGAALRNAQGELLECIRRKATKNDLRAGDDATALETGVLTRFLGGLDRETFDTMFGIDHDELVRGGRALAQGKGNLAQILFAAGTGLAEVRSVQQRLDEEARALFVPQGKSRPRIISRLAEWHSARKAAHDAELPSAEWEKHDKALRQAQHELAETEAQLHSAVPERERLRRVRQAVEPAAKRHDLLQRLAELGPVQILADGFSERRRDAVARLSAARDTARGASEAIEELDEQIAPLNVPDAFLTQGDAIGRLQEALGAYRKAQRDRPLLAARREQAEADAREMLTQVRPDLALENCETLRLSQKQQVELQNLANRHGGLLARREQAGQALEQGSARQRAAERELAALEAPRAAEGLQAVVRRVQAVGHLEHDAAAARAELERLETQAHLMLTRLGLFSGSLDDLERLPVPSVETIDRFETAMSDVDRRLQALAEQAADAETALTAMDRELERLRLESDVPSESQLAESRRRRDAGWQLVRGRWLDGRDETEPQRAFLAEFPPAQDLAGAYEEAVRKADGLADRLRREADRVAQRAGLEADRRRRLADLEKLAGQRFESQRRREKLAAEWAALWQPLGIVPLAPREMRGWLGKQQAAAQQAEALRKQRGALAGIEERIAAARQDLGRSLAELGELPAEDDESLAALIERAQMAVERIKSAAARRGQLEQERATLTRELQTVGRQNEQAERELAAWSSRWALAVAPLGLPADATPAQANEVLSQINSLFDKLRSTRSFADRLDDIALEAEQFASQVGELAEPLAPETAGLAPDQAADRLIAAYQRALADQGRLGALVKQREKHAAQLEAARQAMREAQGVLTALCQEARSTDAERLPEIEQLSAGAKALQQELAHANDTLLLLSGGTALDEFVEEVNQAQSDLLSSRIEALDARIADLEACRQTHSNTVAVESKLLADMDASAAAAEAAERTQCLLAEIGSDVEQYVRLRLASAVLNAAIERYRQKNQGPVLARASGLFALLTAGSFAGLQADCNDAGEAVLVGVRPDGLTVGVEGMSEGTADQLYLALRLASLETYLGEKEPVPFIVDDILIKFDNERSVATLKALAELAERTQVIFFTHHEHLVDLAERHLGKDVLFTHRLPAVRHVMGRPAAP